MLRQILAVFCLGLAVPLLAQVEPAATSGDVLNDASESMKLPPPVAGMAYPALTGDETRSNYLRAGVAVEAAYIDNAFSGQFSHPLAETTITIAPSISLDRTTARHKETLAYTPGFTFYRPTDKLDAIDQSANADFIYRFGPYSALNVTDTFFQTSNLLGQTTPFTIGGDSQFLLVPFSEQISDTLHATFSHQYARNQMFGLGGAFTMLNYPNQQQVSDLYNSKSGGASAFYLQRFAGRHYVGISYEYTYIAAEPSTGESNISIHTFLPSYTFYLTPTASLSLAAGAQRFTDFQTGVVSSTQWTPVASASIENQTPRSNVNLSYARTVTGGGGLIGSYKQDNAALLARLRVTRDWTMGVNGRYANLASAIPATANVNPGGHSILGRGFISRTLGEYLSVEMGYERMHQNYSQIALVANNPDSNRGYVNVSYQFARPLGR